MSTAWLSLGSNLDPETHLFEAAIALRARFGDVDFSPVYRTPAVGFEGPDFLNAAARIEGDFDVHGLNAWLHDLEALHGRRRDGPRYASRTLDIDIVLFDDLVLKGPGSLQLPRPELEHAFVLKPLADLAPELRVPGDDRSLRERWAAHPDHGTLQPDPLKLG